MKLQNFAHRANRDVGLKRICKSSGSDHSLELNGINHFAIIFKTSGI